ncbi:MAG TPA: hypothetical protein VM032_02225 [Vicinamibacterales bacterium]|nr:hypothetical protein [Vicinamibacterales bacterium]
MLMRSFLVFALSGSVASGGAAHAQTLRKQPSMGVAAGAGVGQLWDDETRLGGGAVLSGSVTTGLTDHVRLSGSADWLRHSRSLTYLSAEGQALSAFGRLTYVFGSPGRRVRPLAGGGLGVVRSTGTLKTPAVVAGPNGQPMLATPPSVATDWAVTRGAYDVHGRLRIGLGPNWSLQPEVRWRATLGDAVNLAPSAIEPPLLNMSGLVSVEWRLR